MEILRQLHAQLLGAYRAQKWEDADTLLGKCRSLDIAALATYYDVFSARIANLRAETPPANWDGAYAMTEK